MRKTFTLVMHLLLIGSSISFAQCTGITFIAGTTYSFTSSADGFTGDFTAANGKLNSTTVNAGTTKILTSPTLWQPSSSSSISWGFDLSGSANVTGYVVEAIYYSNGSARTVTVCSAPSTSITQGTRNFTATAPSEILGLQFNLKFTFTVSGGGGVNTTIDNFKTTASFSNAALPVSFSSFEASNANNTIELKWKVGVEENVSQYKVERSSDGTHFSSIGFVSAKGSGTYSFVDYNPSSDNYYRIQSIDVNGKYGYSSIVSAANKKSTIVCKAFPVPAINTVILQHTTAVTGSLITISTKDGRAIKQVIPGPGAQQTEVDLSFAKAGLYLVTFFNNKEITTLKIVKQ